MVTSGNEAPGPLGSHAHKVRDRKEKSKLKGEKCHLPDAQQQQPRQTRQFFFKSENNRTRSWASHSQEGESTEQQRRFLTQTSRNFAKRKLGGGAVIRATQKSGEGKKRRRLSVGKIESNEKAETTTHNPTIDRPLKLGKDQQTGGSL